MHIENEERRGDGSDAMVVCFIIEREKRIKMSEQAANEARKKQSVRWMESA